MKGSLVRPLTLLLILIPLWLLAGCSDDGDDDGGGAVSVTATLPAVTQSAAPTLTAAATPTATPVAEVAGVAVVAGSVSVDFTGSPEELETLEASFEVEPGSSAWDAIKTALGEENLTFEDFGGALGIFITGFNGVEVEGNHFWEFKVNGEGSDVGVSTYIVQQGDVIEFVYSSF
jgi:hypothetical protein